MQKILFNRLSQQDKIEYYSVMNYKLVPDSGATSLFIMGFAAASCFIGLGLFERALWTLNLAGATAIFLMIVNASVNLYNYYKIEKEFTERALKVK